MFGWEILGVGVCTSYLRERGSIDKAQRVRIGNVGRIRTEKTLVLWNKFLKKMADGFCQWFLSSVWMAIDLLYDSVCIVLLTCSLQC